MKTLSLLSALALALALALVGCADASDSKDETKTETKGSGAANEARPLACDNRAIESTCADFAAGTTLENAKASCDGVVLDDPCPTPSAVASCTVSTKDGPMTNNYYPDGPSPHNETDAKEACDRFGGTFAILHPR